MRSSTMRPNKERVINIVLFVGLMNEVRQRMAVERSRMIRKFPDDFAKVMKKQSKFLKDFSLINPVNINYALEQELEDDE